MVLLVLFLQKPTLNENSINIKLDNHTVWRETLEGADLVNGHKFAKFKPSKYFSNIFRVTEA